MIARGDWQVSDVARDAFDLEGKIVGTIGAGRIGYRVLQRLVPFDCKELLYFDYNPLPEGSICGVLLLVAKLLTYLQPLLKVSMLVGLKISRFEPPFFIKHVMPTFRLRISFLRWLHD
jgi:lactate dehydrogenase-like 2-hydroxyacid dehydrogenase